MRKLQCPVLVASVAPALALALLVARPEAVRSGGPVQWGAGANLIKISHRGLVERMHQTCVKHAADSDDSHGKAK